MSADENDNNASNKKRVSCRKIEANRRNAQKSTGPRTLRGKSYSKRNSLKYGFFVRDVGQFLVDEDPREFQKFYKQMYDSKQPVGILEQIEVENIALWSLGIKHGKRYWHAQIESGAASVAKDRENGLYHPWANSPIRTTQILLLRTAKEEVEESGQIPPELMQKIFAKNAELIVLWPAFEAAAEKTARKKRHDIAIRIAEERKIPLSEAEALLVRAPQSLPELKRFVALATVTEAINHLTQFWWCLSGAQVHTEYERKLIPDGPALETFMRWHNFCEKNKRRAEERLDYLQRRRKGEPTLPPVTVRVTE